MAEENSNKRIARNTMLLYTRSLINMVIGMYTSRLTLDALGIADYGIYNVVGSLVALFGLFNGSPNPAPPPAHPPHHRLHGGWQKSCADSDGTNLPRWYSDW